MVKLTKINDRLFQEAFEGSDRPFNWAKSPERLTVDLFEIEQAEYLGLKTEWLGSGDEFSKPTLPAERTRSIRALGKIVGNRSIRLINADGELGEKFREVAVSIYATPRWDEKAESLEGDGEKYVHRFGMLAHNEEEKRHAYTGKPVKSSLDLVIHAPFDLVSGLWEDLAAGKTFASLAVSCKVHAFRSEVDRSLSEPYHFQEYCIERGSFRNQVTLEGISAVGHRTRPAPPDEADWDAPSPSEATLPPPPPAESVPQWQSALVALSASLRSVNTKLTIGLILGVIASLLALAR